MKTLLRFTIRNEQYGILKENKGDANSYINDLTRAFNNKQMLISMERNGRDGYIYTLRDGRITVYEQSADSSTRYTLSTYSDGNKTKTYTSNSLKP